MNWFELPQEMTFAEILTAYYKRELTGDIRFIPLDKSAWIADYHELNLYVFKKGLQTHITKIKQDELAGMLPWKYRPVQHPYVA